MIMVRNVAINYLLNLKDWERRHLPLFELNIGQSIVYRLMRAIANEEKLTVKQLTLDVPHSPAGIRINLRQLEKDGWISMVPHPSDQRIRIIEPSHKLTETIFAYAGQTDCLSKQQKGLP